MTINVNTLRASPHHQFKDYRKWRDTSENLKTIEIGTTRPKNLDYRKGREAPKNLKTIENGAKRSKK